MEKRILDDINLDKIDLNQHKKIILAGSVWYRLVHKGTDPLKPTGKASRFACEPPGYSLEKYSKAFDEGIAISAGTGSTYFCEVINVARAEVSNPEKRDAYKVTLKSDIEVIDIDHICIAEGVGKPYISEVRHPIFHQFYGKNGVMGVYLESAKDYKFHNLVIFIDKFPKFRDMVYIERI